MLHEIGDALAQQPVRADQIQVEHTKAISRQEADQKAADRPVEKARDQADVKREEKKDRSKAEYTLKGKKVVFEKYGRDGDLILQIPSVHADEA
jgi:CTP-dependent riboflavin kinase